MRSHEPCSYVTSCCFTAVVLLLGSYLHAGSNMGMVACVLLHTPCAWQMSTHAPWVSVLCCLLFSPRSLFKELDYTRWVWWSTQRVWGLCNLSTRTETEPQPLIEPGPLNSSPLNCARSLICAAAVKAVLGAAQVFAFHGHTFHEQHGLHVGLQPLQLDMCFTC